VINQSKRWFSVFDGKYDYFLSYWGNYSATYAYLANHASLNRKPFSIFLHAGTDLYRDQIFLEQKLKSACSIFTVCDFNIKYLKQLYPHTFGEMEKKLILYHLGIDLKELNFILDGREDHCLLAVGSLFPAKGFVVILEAMALLKTHFPNIRLVIIGDGPEKTNLVRRAKELAISERVMLSGHLPFEEVKKYMQKCTLLIHPSSELGDAVPTVIKEALACGLPVIASDIAGIPELLVYGQAGLLVKPKDFVMLANSIRCLFQKSVIVFKISSNCSYEYY
jgi:glycosyltransferase involved in cell wall biosynthesis